MVWAAPAGSLPPGADIGEDVRAAEGIDGLLRVADHEQARVRLLAEQGLEDRVLQGVGVLEFVHQSHPEAAADPTRQALAPLSRPDAAASRDSWSSK